MLEEALLLLLMVMQQEFHGPTHSYEEIASFH
jgi:hypothetical protein